MTTKLTVRAVRDELLNSCNRQKSLGDGAGSTRLLGQMFHQLCAALISTDSPTHACNALEDVDPGMDEWRKALIDYAYTHIIGFQLDSLSGQLGLHAEETLQFWKAARELCDWIASVLLGIQELHGNLDLAKRLATCEVPMSLLIREPGWTDEVELTGIADALLRIPGKAAWCVIELKIGQTAPDADAGQAALYQLILSSVDGWNPSDGTLALVSFKPNRVETLLRREQMQDAFSCLKQLVGQMAGVLPKQPAGKPAETEERPQTLSWGTPTAKHDQMKKDLVRVLGTLGIRARISDPPMVGPTFIRFLVEPESGMKINAFNGKEGQLAFELDLDKDPKITRIRGKIAIEIERPDRQTVHFSELRQLLPGPHPLLGNSKLLVGVNVDGSVEFADLAEPEHCHLLVGGTAGSGKSQWLRSAIASLTETNSPGQLQLVLIDPKRNAFTAWRKSPHLMRPIVFPGDTNPVDVLQSLVDEMESRYKRMENVDDLCQLIMSQGSPEPRIVCVCDEYADLVVADTKQRKEIETLLGRLGSKARAAGIHLILATQRPSRDVIRGVINANLPTRIGLTVASAIEAGIIGTPGAEDLLNDGDLLFKSVGDAKRLQGAFVSQGELARIANGAVSAAVA